MKKAELVHDVVLAAQTDYLNSISDEEFLTTYHDVEHNIGPTVEEYLKTQLIYNKNVV